MFKRSLRKTPSLVQDFLDRAWALGIPLTILDADWLLCIDGSYGACREFALKRQILFGTEAYEALSQNLTRIKCPLWNVSSTATAITVFVNDFRIAIVNILQRRRHWLIPAVLELNTSALALRQKYSTRKFNTAQDLHVYYPFPLKAFLTEMKESEFIECRRDMAIAMRQKYPSSYKRPPKLNDSVIDDLAYFRDFLLGLNITPYLFGGTLLGWYRECGIIPHTSDLDMAASISLYKPSLIHALSKDKRLRLHWALGKPNDSLELTVYANSTRIDLFFVYNNGNNSWVGGMIPSQRRKLRWLYPKISRLCKAELLGELFSVPCNVNEILNADYGVKWSHAIEHRTFFWTKSHRNVQHLEKYSDTEWKRVFQVFLNQHKHKH
ncbi:fukutin [Trichuris trichiura]|uniref:Fukutin n=1 Tax=Trichuris trichiura TaxID=36087 RepID=A0A077ZND1_TRITR|nr:fukutin [Trichuris trichiura]